MFDFMNMMNKVKEVQAKVKEVQGRLVHLTAEGEAGAGGVAGAGHDAEEAATVEEERVVEPSAFILIAASRKDLNTQKSLSANVVPDNCGTSNPVTNTEYPEDFNSPLLQMMLTMAMSTSPVMPASVG